MPYRQGLMAARGDYYGLAAGGGLFDIIGKWLGFVGGLLPGPVGTIAKFAGGVLSPPSKQNPIGATLPPPPPMGTGISIGGSKGVQIGSFPQPISQFAPGRSFGPLSATGKKRRRMNVTNVKALRRAGRRVVGFEKLAKRFIGFASPRKPRGRMYFRKKSRAR